jgi:hypothetical protein
VRRDAVIYKESVDGRRCVAIDIASFAELFDHLDGTNLTKKFNYIVDTILDRSATRENYDKEDINERCKDVTAMKFKGNVNSRIYCKQESLTDENGQKMFVVIAAKLHKRKKSQKNTSTEIALIEAVATYEYDYRNFTKLDDEDDEADGN